jgi:hypothetical protein
MALLIKEIGCLIHFIRNRMAFSDGHDWF